MFSPALCHLVFEAVMIIYSAQILGMITIMREAFKIEIKSVKSGAGPDGMKVQATLRQYTSFDGIAIL